MARGTYTCGNQGTIIQVTGGNVEIEIMQWDRTEETDTDRFSTNKTAGQKTSEPGNAGSTGTIQGKLVEESGFDHRLLFMVGAKITCKLGYTASKGITQPMTVKSFQVGVNADTGEMETYTINWESTDAGVPY